MYLKFLRLRKILYVNKTGFALNLDQSGEFNLKNKETENKFKKKFELFGSLSTSHQINDYHSRTGLKLIFLFLWNSSSMQWNRDKFLENDDFFRLINTRLKKIFTSWSINFMIYNDFIK